MNKAEENKLIYEGLYQKYNWSMERNVDREFYKQFKEYEAVGGVYKLNFGDWFLFEIEKNVNYDKGKVHTLHYPKLAIFNNYLICDQALDIEYLEYRKSWEGNVSAKENKYNFIFDRQGEVKSHIEWFDSMWIYGQWDHRPNWKELREAFKKTQWYYRTKDEIRDFRLNTLLG